MLQFCLTQLCSIALIVVTDITHTPTPHRILSHRTAPHQTKPIQTIAPHRTKPHGRSHDSILPHRKLFKMLPKGVLSCYMGAAKFCRVMVNESLFSHIIMGITLLTSVLVGVETTDIGPEGNKIIAQKLFELSLPIITDKIIKN